MKGIDVTRSAISAVAKHPKLLLLQLLLLLINGAIAIALVVPSLTQIFPTNSTATTPALNPSATVHLLISLIPNFLTLIIVSEALGIFVTVMYMEFASKWKNSQITFSELFGSAVSRYVPALIFLIIITIIQLAVLTVLFYSALSQWIGILASGTTPSTSTSLNLFVSFAVPLLVLFVIELMLNPLFFAGLPLVVLGNKDPISALKASIDAGRKDFLGILGIFLIFGIVYGIIWVLSTALSCIPIIGVVFSIIFSVFMGMFASLPAPLYYLMYVNPQSPSTAQTPASTTTRRRRKQ